MPAGLYFKLIMIVILIILDYFFPKDRNCWASGTGVEIGALSQQM